MTTKGTYHKKRNEFSELHYLLPKTCNMFDLDLFLTSNDNSATFIESNCNFDADLQDKFNLDKFKPRAIFEYKHHYTMKVVDLLELPIYSSVWSAFMTAKMLNVRFFIIVATNGKAPFYFIEYDRAGIILMQGNRKYKVLDYTPETAKESINNFWKNELQLL